VADQLFNELKTIKKKVKEDVRSEVTKQLTGQVDDPESQMTGGEVMGMVCEAGMVIEELER